MMVLGVFHLSSVIAQTIQSEKQSFRVVPSRKVCNIRGQWLSCPMGDYSLPNVQDVFG
jgi:hypothetical protein